MILILRAFILCHRGIAAMEFALVLPIGITLLFGISEVSTALLIDRKVSRATHIAADLVSQERGVDQSDINNVFESMETVLDPFSARAHMRITSVVLNEKNKPAKVDWSDARNGRRDTGTYVLPKGLVNDVGDSVIVTHIVYSHSPLFAGAGFGILTLEDKAYFKPRRGRKVTGPD